MHLLRRTKSNGLQSEFRQCITVGESASIPTKKIRADKIISASDINLRMDLNLSDEKEKT